MKKIIYQLDIIKNEQYCEPCDALRYVIMILKISKRLSCSSGKI